MCSEHPPPRPPDHEPGSPNRHRGATLPRAGRPARRGRDPAYLCGGQGGFEGFFGAGSQASVTVSVTVAVAVGPATVVVTAAPGTVLVGPGTVVVAVGPGIVVVTVGPATV